MSRGFGAAVSADLRAQCPLISRPGLWSSLLTSTIEFCSGWTHGPLWPGQSPQGSLATSTGSLTSAQLPLVSDTLVSTKFFISVITGPGITLEFTHPIIATSVQVYWLASDISLNWVGPGPPHSELLLESQWSNGARISWPPLTLHVSTLLPEAREVKSELGSDSVTCHHSFPYSHNILESQGLDFLAIPYSALCSFCNCKPPVWGERGTFLALWENFDDRNPLGLTLERLQRFSKAWSLTR